jgi:serine/threonine-protein kinase
MPYVKGESLQKRLDRAGTLGTSEVLRIGRQIAAGLAAAHAQGLIHRDIKPANILLEENVDRLQLTDFGLARTVDDASETRTGIIAGTPQYMSPEQARGDALDIRSDLFSVGSVMYAMCAGRPPFRAETPYGILRRITDDTPRPLREINPEIPDWLEAIIAKLHAKEPSARFTTSDELAETLEQCLAHVRQPATAALPESVAKLVSQSRPRSLQKWRIPGGAPGHVAAAILSLAILIALIVVVGEVAERAAGLRTNVRQAIERSSVPQSSGANPGYAWDQIDREAWELQKQTEELTGRAEQLWDTSKDAGTK